MKITFDTNIMISRGAEIVLPSNFYLSIVVLQELIAGAEDITAVKHLQASFSLYQKEGRLLVPTAEDWVEVGKVINSLQRGRRSSKTKLIPKIGIEERYRITSDVLIARTAKRAGVTIVTDNLADFEKIQNFCAVKIMSGAQYFGT